MTARANLAAAAADEPLKGLYAFVRNHLAIVNGLVLSSGTLVAVLDFLAPKLSILPRLIYSATAAVVVLMVLAAFAPALVERALSALGLAMTRDDLVPLWRRPAWQVGVVLLAAVTVAGFASVAKAGQGGALASRFPELRAWQESLLSLRRDVADIGVGVRQANDKLDRVVASVDPANAADRCADLECALQGGASSKTVRRLFERGAKVPGNPVSDGELLRMAIVNRGEGRFETIDLLFQHGVARDTRFMANYFSPGEVSREGLRWAKEIDQAARLEKLASPTLNVTGDEGLKVWNRVTSCFFVASGGVTALELAALLGDRDMVAHLTAGGSKFPGRPLVCARKTVQGAGFARVVFDTVAARVRGVES